MSKFLSAALEYVEAGIPVFPLVPKTKKPLTSNGVKDATLDVEQVKKWWAHHPNANIGVPMGKTSGVVGIDIDYKDGCRENFLTSIPPTVVQKSPSGGHHAFFKYPSEGVKNGKKLEVGATVRADGYYFAVTPSVFLNPETNKTGEYSWEAKGLGVGELFELPEWILNHPGIKLGKTGEWVSEGSRHDALKTRAASLRKSGKDRETILSELVNINSNFPDGAKSSAEVLSIVDWTMTNVAVAVEVVIPPSGMSDGDIIHTKFPDETDKGKRFGSIANVRVMLRRTGIIVRYNIISKEEELIIPGGSFTTDNQANVTLAMIIDWCVRCRLPYSALDGQLTALAEQNIYNPVATWIESKPWDGVSRLCDLFETIESTTEMKDTLIKRWLVSAIAMAFEPDGASAGGILVLQGDQYIGKTQWFKSLVPLDLGLTATGVILRPEDKDSVAAVISKWMIELGELDATFRKSDIAQLKAFITNDRDVLRMPYARRKSNYARRTAIFASVNSTSYLVDETGNRRFWTVECSAINFNHGIDMQQLWSEVLVLYRAGERWHLTPAENDALNKHNESFITQDPLEERIRHEYNWESQEPKRELTATQVCQELGIQNAATSQTRKVGWALRKIFPQKPRLLDGLSRFQIPRLKKDVGMVDVQVMRREFSR